MLASADQGKDGGSISRLNLHEARCQQGQEWPFVWKDKLVFIHLPKTAGTSFYWFLSTFFSHREIVPARQQLQPVAAWSPASWRQYRFFHGAKCVDEVRRLLPFAHFVTLLRDPVRRVISYYWFLRRPYHFGADFPEVAARRGTNLEKARSLSLHDWVRTSRQEPGAYVRNLGLAKLTCGPSAIVSATTADLDALLDRAKQTLRDHFAFVGITEEYTRSKLLFCRTFGLPQHYARGEERANVSPFAEARQPVESEIIDVIQRENAHDIELYEFARELFEERLAALKDSFPEHAPGSPAIALPRMGKLRLTPDRIRGSGLYAEEVRTQGGSFRWTGGLPTTIIDVIADLPAGADLTVRIAVPFANDRQYLQSMSIRFDGQPALECRQVGLRWFRRSTTYHCRFRVSPEGAKKSHHFLELQCPSARPAASRNGDRDARQLGVALGEIELEWR